MRASLRSIAVAAFLLLMSPTAHDLRAQSDRPEWNPFTDEELYRAFRVGSTDADARQLVADLRRAEAEMAAAFDRHRGESPRARPAEPDAIVPAFGSTLSEDTLVILSLLGEATEAKVQHYLEARLGGRPMTPEFQRDWQARRETLRPWVEAELRRLGPPGSI
jgi:hypothetical protein